MKANTRRHIIHNKNGSFPIIETLVTIGVSVILLTIYFTSTINLYTVYDSPDVDLNAKSVGALEKLLSSTGQGANYSQSWEHDPYNVSLLGLGTSPTTIYGILQITDEGEVIIHSRHSFSDRIGPVEMCFLADTKILMADGSYKNIEDVKVGDIVRSYDEENDKLVTGRVTRVFRHPSEEMIDHYLLINGVLKVTPNHRFYSGGEWIYAGDLKTGDVLSHTLYRCSIYSIEKIFEKHPTYDLEVDVYHNYFVAMDTIDILVHNTGLKPPGWFNPRAEFIWFDCDGLATGKKIYFDASESKFFWWAMKCYTWWFDWSGDESQPDDQNGSNPIAYNTYTDNNPHVVRLKVNDSWGNDSIVYTVQANKFDDPDITPGTVNDINIYPETGNQTTASYDENYYVEYTDVSDELGDGYYLYEIKEKISSPNPIVDYQKINSLWTVNYYDAKAALGFNATLEYAVYNFNIELTSNDGWPLIPSYGADYDDPESVVAMYSCSREVLIYYKPKVIDIDNIEKPYYETGRITVRMFLGGEVPNYPPFAPWHPSPSHTKDGVRWDAVLSWLCGDQNGDRLKYDVFFGTDPTPDQSENVSYNQSDTSYDPYGPDIPGGLMTPDETYYWQIVAKDIYNASTAGSVWWFQTAVDRPPYEPSNPSPKNNSSYVDVTGTILSWIGGDPDEYMGDNVRYNVYFGASDECQFGGPVGDVESTLLIPLRAQDLYNTYWDPFSHPSYYGRLRYNTTYYWRIIARDYWGLITVGPIWSFTTKEKGLDQHHTEGSDQGESTTDYRLGQTFTAGMSGNLTNIELSLKYTDFAGMPPEDISVELYEYSEDGTQGEFLADTTIPSFNDIEFSWKNAVFNNPIPVNESQKYFIVVNQTIWRTYSWQYSKFTDVGDTLGESGGNDYPDGEAYFSCGHEWVEFDISRNVQDFLFKTYVFREPSRDQFCLDQTSLGESTEVNNLMQTFIAGRSSDLMKVNLSLAWVGGAPGDITVEIYDYNEEKGIPENELTNTTIPAIGGPEFIWREVNFDNIPYLVEEEMYFIVVTTHPLGPVVAWENSNDEACYPEGEAMLDDKRDEIWMPLPLQFDFIFETYMDDIG